MSNKAAGTRFEKEFAERMARHGFWVHLFQDNHNGQPGDVIAARDGNAYLFDCKSCEKNHFRLSRMEENQLNAMELFHMTGNRRGMFAIQFQSGPVYLVDYLVLKELRDQGMKSLKRTEMHLYGRTFEDWMAEQDISPRRGGGRNAYRHWQ